MKIVLISTNASFGMGGEAMKAIQYFDHLLKHGYDVVLLTHARCRNELSRLYPGDRLLFVEDDATQRLFWRSVALRGFLTTVFHRRAARICQQFDPAGTVLHYICPISPIEARYPPKGYDVVLGPLNGNLPYPQGFRHRMNPARRANLALHLRVQAMMRVVNGEKPAARVVLNSGGARTLSSLRAAGATQAQIRPVRDAGVSARFLDADRVRHAGRNAQFVCLGRLVDVKATDLVLRALALASPDSTLTILGDGPLRASLQALAHRLDLGARVRFAGYVDQAQAIEVMAQSRALLFPSLAEANGIAVQEAMALGLPVVALDWGGPAVLLDKDSAILIEPVGEDQVVRDLAAAMDRLAADPAKAEAMSVNARHRAATAFPWPVVAGSWAEAYERAAIGQSRA